MPRKTWITSSLCCQASAILDEGCGGCQKGVLANYGGSRFPIKSGMTEGNTRLLHYDRNNLLDCHTAIAARNEHDGRY